jgi:hypothetical protein
MHTYPALALVFLTLTAQAASEAQASGKPAGSALAVAAEVLRIAATSCRNGHEASCHKVPVFRNRAMVLAGHPERVMTPEDYFGVPADAVRALQLEDIRLIGISMKALADFQAPGP